MKRLFFLLLLPTGLFALYQGNPAAPEIPEEGIFSAKEVWLAIKLGIEQDFVIDRKMKLTHTNLQKRVQTFKENITAGAFSLGFCDRIQIEGILGSMQVAISHFPQEEVSMEYESRDHLAFGSGIKAILAYCGNARFGINGRWIRSYLPLTNIRLNETPTESRGKLKYDEWEVGGGVAYKIEAFVPYFNLYFTQAMARTRRLRGLEFLFPKAHFSMKNRYCIGLALGCTIAPVKAFEGNVEVRMIDQQAVAIAGGFLF